MLFQTLVLWGGCTVMLLMLCALPMADRCKERNTIAVSLAQQRMEKPRKVVFFILLPMNQYPPTLTCAESTAVLKQHLRHKRSLTNASCESRAALGDKDARQHLPARHSSSFSRGARTTAVQMLGTEILGTRQPKDAGVNTGQAIPLEAEEGTDPAGKQPQGRDKNSTRSSATACGYSPVPTRGHVARATRPVAQLLGSTLQRGVIGVASPLPTAGGDAQRGQDANQNPNLNEPLKKDTAGSPEKALPAPLAHAQSSSGSIFVVIIAVNQSKISIIVRTQAPQLVVGPAATTVPAPSMDLQLEGGTRSSLNKQPGPSYHLEDRRTHSRAAPALGSQHFSSQQDSSNALGRSCSRTDNCSAESTSPIRQTTRNELIQQEKKHPGLNCRQAAGVRVIIRVWQSVGTAHTPKTTAQAFILSLHICASETRHPHPSSLNVQKNRTEPFGEDPNTQHRVSRVTTHRALLQLPELADEDGSRKRDIAYWDTTSLLCGQHQQLPVPVHTAQTSSQMEVQCRANPFLSSTLPFANSRKYFSPTEVSETHLETKGDGGHLAGDSIIPDMQAALHARGPRAAFLVANCKGRFPLHTPDLVLYLQVKVERCDRGDRLQGFTVQSTLVTAATSEFQTNNQRHSIFSSKQSENTLMLISQPLLGSSARNSLQVSAGMVVDRLQLIGAPLTFSSRIAMSNDRNDQTSVLKVSHINLVRFLLVYEFTRILPLTRITLSPLLTPQNRSLNHNLLITRLAVRKQQ
ncbi:hypothetical protein Anapl_05400 [Anas platyrhynchos]|uniref:Uncharacterized protein n=1 Tax=Anas platyrhynchos TaxID=8839 RepID=R0KS91_ANAPL|nr:hypothetical protein Anapl_05400 [Anas platyrhynchos]